MYSSSFITHTFLTILLFQLQDTSVTANYGSGLMRLRAQKRSLTLADSQPSERIFSSSDNHLRPEERSTKELTTTSTPGGIFVDESDPGQDQIQLQSWLLHQEPVETMLLTACTSTTTSTDEESDRSILPPSAKFQRRQSQSTVPPNACPPDWKDPQAGQHQKLKLDGQGQGQENGNRETIPDDDDDDDDEALEELRRKFYPGQQLSKWNTYPTYLELFRLFTYGRDGNPNSICDEFEGRSIPMCAPSSLALLESPAEVLAPSRFCKYYMFFSFLFFHFRLHSIFFPLFIIFFFCLARDDDGPTHRYYFLKFFLFLLTDLFHRRKIVAWA